MEKVEEIKKRIFVHPGAEEIHIKRIPKDVAKRFKEFANEEFVGDYGMALKHLLDVIPTLANLNAIIQSHEDRLVNLESGEKKESRRVKTCSGKIIKY